MLKKLAIFGLDPIQCLQAFGLYMLSWSSFSIFERFILYNLIPNFVPIIGHSFCNMDKWFNSVQFVFLPFYAYINFIYTVSTNNLAWIILCYCKSLTFAEFTACRPSPDTIGLMQTNQQSQMKLGIENFPIEQCQRNYKKKHLPKFATSWRASTASGKKHASWRVDFTMPILSLSEIQYSI